MGPKPKPLADRIAGKIEVDPDTGCWIWTGTVAAHGYGVFSWRRRTAYVHRVLFEHFVGPIEEGLVLDHLCRVRHCCNPDHLEAVTQQTNTLRGVGPAARNAAKTHCPQGHPYSGENLVPDTRGNRCCAACKKRHNANRYLSRA